MIRAQEVPLEECKFLRILKLPEVKHPEVKKSASLTSLTEMNPNECQKVLFGVCLVKCTPSIVNIVFFEVSTPNRQRSAVHRMFATQTNAECLGYTSILTLLSFTHALFGIRIQMQARLKTQQRVYAPNIVMICIVIHSNQQLDNNRS